MTNALTITSAIDALVSQGAREGAAATSMIERAETLFLYAEVLVTKHGKEAAREAYLAYANAFNANDKRGAAPIDLANAKSLKSQVGKFNTFIKLGAVERTQRHDFIARACDVWTHGELNDNGEAIRPTPDARGSMWNAVCKAASTQVREGKLLSDAEIYDAMFPAQEPKTRVDGLQALADNLAKHIEKWAQDAIPGSHALHALDHLVKALADAKANA